MQLHLRFAVLKRILRALGLIGQPPFLSQRHKTDPQLVGNRRSEEKSTRVDSDDFVDLLAAASIEKDINGCAKELSVAEDRGDVFKDDTGLRKIRHIAHRRPKLMNRVGNHGAMLPFPLQRSTSTARRESPIVTFAMEKGSS